ncbi:zinc finger BED domain-containing protein 4-like [Acanthochromis polyacanthus]|uniref:zinc finger BED domain-containing protein 4-like n=1 Tax=Acanthochromis polyacanthus TaxID=80966 RepID=UPI0022343AD8|nr:zinc finger BED domain-containing protein 4-like [Acanthochromis polyacanthus]
MTKICELYETEKEKKHEDLTVAKHVALTGDYWTSVSNSNYLGVTAHLITAAWELKSFALRVMKTEEHHFAEACAEHFLIVTREWEIEEKITTVGTDGARNMTAAAKILPFEHMLCVAHILQRCVTVSLGDSGFVSALSKRRKIVGHIKHSPANTLELEAQQATLGQWKEPLIQDVPTRWNSTLEMINRLNRNQAAIKATLDQQSHKLVMLTPQEWDKLQKLESLLEPGKYVTEILGGESYVSCSVVLPAFCHLRHVMETSGDDPAYVSKFKTAFQEDLTSRQERFVDNEWLKIATALDPRFKDLKCLPKSDRERVWTTLGQLLHEQSPPRQSFEDKPPKKKGLLQMGSDSESDEELLPDRLMHLYRAEPTISIENCPLEWWSAHWRAHEKLALLACKYLTTLATTVPCERLFSVAGNIVNKKRSSLLSDNVNKLVCLNSWLKKE